MKTPPVRPRIPAAIFSVVAVACGAVTFWPTYRSSEFVVMAVVTILVGSAIGCVGALARASSVIVAAATVAAYLILGVPLAIPGEAIAGVLPSWRGVVDLLTTAALGWKQLVTITTPVGAYQALLVPAFLLTLLAAVTTTTLAMRARHGQWALIPPIVLFSFGIVLGPQSASTPLAAGLALVVVLLLWTVWFRRRVTVRSAVAAGVVIAISASAGIAVASIAPGSTERAVARNVLEQPFHPRDYPSPLSGFRAYLQPERAHTPMLTVKGLDGVRRIRIATLDTYDGVVYSVGDRQNPSASGTFSRVPGTVGSSGSGGKMVQVSVTVDGYRGVWLPSVGTVQSIRFAGARAGQLQNSIYYNQVTGTAAVLGGVAAGERYTVAATTQRVKSIAELSDARPGAAQLPKLGVVPDGLDEAIAQASGSERAAGKQLAASLKALTESGYVSHGIGQDEPASASGHSAARISELLSGDPMIGDAEQYAVAAALMARRIGFPARVVVGFLVPPETQSAGSVTVTGSDISAWIQIQTARDGWVSVDPNPPVRPIPHKQRKEPEHISRPQSNVDPPVDATKHDAAQPPESDAAQQPDDAANPLLALLMTIAKISAWTLLGMAIVASPFLAVIAAKARRRRLRKKAGSPIERITGGWREFEDTALDTGIRPPRAATRSEVAVTVGGMAPLVLASLADRAVFSCSAATDEDADVVWKSVDELRESMREGTTRWQRIRAAVSLASLDGYRGRYTKNGRAPR